jgi:hypothetical protein
MVVDLKIGESISFDMPQDMTILLIPGVDIRKVRLTLEAKTGQVARVRVQADESVRVFRTL